MTDTTSSEHTPNVESGNNVDGPIDPNKLMTEHKENFWFVYAKKEIMFAGSIPRSAFTMLFFLIVIINAKEEIASVGVQVASLFGSLLGPMLG